MLLHGGPGLYDYFDELAALIDDLVEVHRYDQRAAGRSEGGPPYDVATFVADLDALREHWRHDRWVVAGHSWGVSLALAYALAHPDRVSALILLDGTGVIEDWREDYHRNAAALLSREERSRHAELRAMAKNAELRLTSEQEQEYCVLTWMTDYADRGRRADLARRLLRPYGPNYEVNDVLSKDWSRLLADGSFAEGVRAIDVPVLVMHGEQDPRPPRLSERLAASLPNAQLALVPEAGHLPWVERPDLVREALRSFLVEVAQPAAPAVP